MSAPSYDVGDTVNLDVTVDPADVSTAAVCTVTTPDGTDSTPAVTSPATGQFSAGVVVDAAGLWTVKWVVTGTGAGIQRGVFDVLPEPTDPIPDSYATLHDLTQALRDIPPAGSVGLLVRASALVSDAIGRTIYSTDPDTDLPTSARRARALIDATCAQVQWWQAAGINPIIGAAGDSGPVTMKQADKVTLQYAVSLVGATVTDRAAGAYTLCDRAIEILRTAHLTGSRVWAYG